MCDVVLSVSYLFTVCYLRLIAHVPAVAKVMQMELTVSFVFECDGQTTVVHESLPSIPQVLDHNTSEATRAVLRWAWSHFDQLQEIIALFPYSVHGSTSDRAASNMKYERSEFRDCNETSNSLHLPCDVHRLGTVMGNEFSMIPRLVSSVIGFGVSQRSGGSMELFRECVTICLQQRFLGLSPHQRPHDTLV